MKKPPSVDPTLIRAPGNWEHLDVSANGQRFHLTTRGSADQRRVVVLLHGFPQYWWAWRHIFDLLESENWLIAAFDLRGFGGSDKPPTGYDLSTLTADVIGVLHSLGAKQAVIVGHGIGGAIAWMSAQLEEGLVAGIAPISAPHPLGVRSLRSRIFSGGAVQYGILQLPLLPQRALLNGHLVRGMLRAWSGAKYAGRVLSQADRYTKVLRRPGAARAALEQLRKSRRMGTTDRVKLAKKVEVPVLSVHGQIDPILPSQAFARDGHYVNGQFTQSVLPDCGHFPMEEDPVALAKVLRPFVEECFKISTTA